MAIVSAAIAMMLMLTQGRAMVDGGQDGGDDGHDRLLGAALSFEAIALGLQIAAFLSCCP
jgi:hypothetical protein